MTEHTHIHRRPCLQSDLKEMKFRPGKKCILHSTQAGLMKMFVFKAIPFSKFCSELLHTCCSCGISRDREEI